MKQPRETALPELMDEYGEQMYRFALRQCGNPHDAQDLVQKTFLKAHQNGDQFDGRSKVTTWLFTIATPRCPGIPNRGRMARRGVLWGTKKKGGNLFRAWCLSPMNPS